MFCVFLVFFFFFFGPKACEILVPRPGIEPTFPALEDEVSTSGPPRKSQYQLILDADPMIFHLKVCL